LGALCAGGVGGGVTYLISRGAWGAAGTLCFKRAGAGGFGGCCCAMLVKTENNAEAANTIAVLFINNIFLLMQVIKISITEIPFSLQTIRVSSL